MAAQVTNVRTLGEFKRATGTGNLGIFTSKAGNKYAKNDQGEFVGMLAPDFDKSEEVIVFSMSDDDTGESWLFIANGTPQEPEFTI